MGALPDPLTRSLKATASITVTELYNAGQLAANNPDLYPKAQCSERLDERVCPLCASLHRKVFDVRSDLFKRFFDPSHIGCFPAGVVVSGPRAVASTARWYAGEIIELRTAAGHFVPVTPNHPILTPKGWVAAGLLQEGDYVVSGGNGERVGALVDPDDYQVPALIEEVVGAFDNALGGIAVRMPVSAEDFHGDGCGSKICVVRSDGLLGDAFDTPLCEPHLKQLLAGGDVGSVGLAGEGHSAALLGGMLSASGGDVRCRGESAVLLGGALGRHEAVGLGPATKFNASGNQAGFDGAAANAEMSGKRTNRLARLVASDDFGIGQRHSQGCGAQSPGSAAVAQDSTLGEGLLELLGAHLDLGRGFDVALAGQVCLDRILNVGRVFSAGHVYNLETSNGWYFANNIIAHNCRRRWLWIAKDDPAPVTAVEPDPQLVAKHGHYHLNPDKYAEYRLPAQPSGRQAIVRRVKNTETGEVATRVDWAPWLQQVPANKLKLVLKARATTDAAELRSIAEALGVSDLTDPAQLQQAILLGIYDRLKGWVTTEYLQGGASTMSAEWPVAAAPEAPM